MSITAQVDTASIDVSLDMHELRREIAEVMGEELPDLITDAFPQVRGHNEEIRSLRREVSDMQKRVDELTARIVGAGCMLTGTRTQS